MWILRQLWTSLRQLAVSWYRVDRIRSTPSTGRLFQVCDGSRLLIGERLFDVISRTEQFAESSRVVDYCLSSEDGSARLTVSLTEEHGVWWTTAELCCGDSVEVLLEGDVTVLNAATWIVGSTESREPPK